VIRTSAPTMGAHVLSVRTFLMHGVFAPCTVTRFAIWITGSLSGSGKWPLRPCRDNPIQSCRQALPPGGLLGYRESTQRTHLRGLQDYRDDCETRGGVGLPATVFDREAYVVYSIHERTAFQLRVAARSTERRIRIPPPPRPSPKGFVLFAKPERSRCGIGRVPRTRCRS
jgi:hypothetical protein